MLKALNQIFALMVEDDVEIPEASEPKSNNNKPEHLAQVGQNKSISKISGSNPSTSLQRTSPPNPKEYLHVRKVGHGGEGECSLIKLKATNKLLVLKTVKTPKIRHNNKPLEAAILQDILPSSHPNIIRLHSYQTFAQGSAVKYYFEHCAGGDLEHLVWRYQTHPGSSIPELFIWKTFTQLASGLEFLHRGFSIQGEGNDRLGVVHRDIKPNNIFLRLPTNEYSYPDLVIGDFGIASFDPDTDQGWGTWEWQGPEIPRYTPKGDVYSLGAVIHYMTHLERPFADLEDMHKKGYHTREEWELNPLARQPKTNVPEGYSEALCGFMLRAVEGDLEKRIDSKTLVMELERFLGKNLARFEGKGDESYRWPLADWALGEEVEAVKSSRRKVEEVKSPWTLESKVEGMEAPRGRAAEIFCNNA